MNEFPLFQEFYSLDTEKNIRLIYEFSDKYPFLTNLEKSLYLSLVGRYNRAIRLKYNEYDIERIAADIDRALPNREDKLFIELYSLKEIIEKNDCPDLDVEKLNRILNFMEFSYKNDSPTEWKEINTIYRNLVSYYHSVLTAFFSNTIE